MDPSPAPESIEGIVQATDNILGVAAFAFFGLLVALVLVALLVWAIYKAAQYQPQAMLVVVLGVLALVSAIGYFVGGNERAELVTLAATAVGALAGALTLMTQRFVDSQQSKKVDDEPPTEETPPIQPTEDEEDGNRTG